MVNACGDYPCLQLWSGLISQQQFDPNSHLPSTNSYYGYDGHGSIRFLMDANGTMTDTYTYDAYGNLISRWYSGSSPTPNNYLYSAQQFDPDFGLYYNRARYLNTDIGRFCSSDSTDGNNEDPLSLHKYLYAEDNPVTHIDPSGHQIDDIMVATGMLGFMGIPSTSIPTTIPGTTYIYMSVDPNDMPMGLDLHEVQRLLQQELTQDVFNNLPAGRNIKTTVRQDATDSHLRGWYGNYYHQRISWDLSGDAIALTIPHSSFTQVNWRFVRELVTGWDTYNNGAPLPQDYANIFAHEVFWHGTGNHADDMNRAHQGDLSSWWFHHTIQYGLFPATRATIRSDFGF